ncbi:MAG: hypothetical protein GX238_07405 [Epulopiscium sp.]|nr:hypothetical protein [Candidatus Epulonipiscium sp.]
METLMNFLGVFITGIVLTRIVITIQMMKQYQKAQKHQMSSTNMENEIEPSKETMVYRPVDIEVVQDHMTGESIPKLQAYQLVREEKTYYFSSWEDRERFIESTKNDQIKDIKEEPSLTEESI